MKLHSNENVNSGVFFVPYNVGGRTLIVYATRGIIVSLCCPPLIDPPRFYVEYEEIVTLVTL